MKKLTLAFVACALAAPASAQTYKCQSGGKFVYQDRPCGTGQSQSKVERSNLTESEVRQIERDRRDKEFRKSFDAALDRLRRTNPANECDADALLSGSSQREKICLAVGRVLRCSNVEAEAKDVILFKATRDFGVEKRDYANITSRRPGIGMNSCSVIAALGHPEKVNRTVSSRGVKQQLVYGSGKYVYLDDDVVTAWQD